MTFGSICGQLQELKTTDRAMKETSLCLRCKALQVPSLFNGPRYECEEDLIYSENLDVRVASISDLRKNGDCPLCRLLSKIYTYEQTDHDAEKSEELDHFASRQDPRKVYCILRPTRADVVMEYDAGTVADKMATHLLVEFDPAVPAMFHTWNQGRADAAQGVVSNPQIGYKPKSLYRGWTIAPDVSSATPNRPMMNRLPSTDQVVNIKQLESLLEICGRHHPACKRPISADQAAEPIQIVLLDVTERRIVHADTRTRYVALSYVWDLIDREGYQGFKEGFKEGSLVQDLPCIMEDSIAVVKGLGERFLWIDLLCIDQNNPAKKKVQISQMNIIYSHADFTLVALARSSVHSGLPGIQPASRTTNNYEILIEGRTFVVAAVWYHFYTIAGSTWNSRAWTLEEGMLSTRCIFFGPHEVLFDCCSGVGSETLGLPVHSLPNQTSVSLKHLPRYQEYRFWNKSFPKDWGFGFYADNVWFYSQRDLSHARDSLNAFTGVLSALSQSTGMLFMHGLPRKDFLKALLWYPIFSSSRLPGFPSWTWAGWTGPRAYDSVYHTLIENIHTNDGADTTPSLHGTVAEVTIPPLGSDDHQIRIASQVRLFDLRSANPSKKDSAYNLFNSKGRLVLDLLGSRGNHGSTPRRTRGYPSIGGTIFLDPASTLSSETTHFLYLLHWKAGLSRIDFPREEETRSKRDHVLTMLIRKLADDTFERMGLCGIPIDEWDDAPIADGLECITLV